MKKAVIRPIKAVAILVMVLASLGAANGEQSRSNGELPEINNNAVISDYLQYAALNNPQLKTAFYNWKAALERIPQARALPDPKFNYGYFVRKVETRVGPQEQKVGISQMFPWLGKLRIKENVATQEANALQSKYEAAKLRLFYQVKNAYYEYLFIGQAIAITKENVELLKNWEKVLLTKYATAQAKHQHLIKVQVELGKLEDQLQTMIEMAKPIQAQFNALLNRDIQKPILFPAWVPVNIQYIDSLELNTWLKEANPELRAMAFQVAKAEQMVRLKRRSFLPDFMIGADYVFTGPARNPAMVSADEDGKDPFVVMGSITIPLWVGKNSASVREAKAMKAAMENTKQNMENQLQAKLEKTLFRVRDSRRKMELYGKTLLQKAQESLKTTEVAFQAAGVSFLDLVDAQRLLLKFQLENERAKADYAQSVAELEMIVARELPKEKEN